MDGTFAEADDGMDAAPSSEALAERRLLDELKRGSREAAEKLVEATYARVYGICTAVDGKPRPLPRPRRSP